jgi:hypothetical protein
MNNLVYEDTSRYDFWLKFILVGVLALTFIAGVILLYEDTVAAWIMLGATLFDALLFKAILPQRFQIFEDGLKIVLGGPFAINIPFSDIRKARRASGRKTFIYWGQRFATSSRYVVEIVRKRSMDLVISPTGGDIFLEQLKQAMEAASNSSGRAPA